MADPADSSSSPVHPLLEPATIEELRKRVAERRMAREASGRKVPKPPKTKPARRSPTVSRTAVSVTPAPISAAYPDPPVDPDFISPSVAAVMCADLENRALCPVERAQIRMAISEADRESAELARAAAASASMVPADPERHYLVDAIVGWLVSDFDPADEFQTVIRARYLPQLYEFSPSELHGFEGELAKAFAQTQTSCYVPPPQTRIARLDSLLRSCQGDVCPIVQIMTKDSLCAFQFHELRKFEVPPKWDGNY